MWDCLACGCRAIAASLLGCPVCRTERDMAKATSGGASNAGAQPFESGHVAPEVPVVPVVAAEVPEAAEPEPQPAVADADGPPDPPADDAVPVVPEPARAVSAAPRPAPAPEPEGDVSP